MTDKLFYRIGKRKTWQVLLLLVLIAGFAVSVQADTFFVDRVSSTTLVDPGYFELGNSLGNFNSTNCIVVNTNDIIIDGKNLPLGTDPLNTNPGAAIKLNPGVQNVTIKNFNIGGNFNWSINGAGTSSNKINTAWIESNTITSKRVGILVDWGQNVYINDNSIRHLTGSGSSGTGILIRNHTAGAAPITIEHNIIEEIVGEGVIVQDTVGTSIEPGVKIIDNKIRLNALNGILLTNFDPTVSTGTYTTISGDNNITGNYLNGISITNNSRLYTIDGNKIRENRIAGINENQTSTHSSSSDRNVILNNIVSGNLINEMVFNGSYPVNIGNNTLEGNQVSTFSSINATNSGSFYIYQNRISNTLRGINIDRTPFGLGDFCGDSLIENNTIFNFGIGILNHNTTSNLTIVDNIIDNGGSIGLSVDVTGSRVQNNTIQDINDGIWVLNSPNQILDNDIEGFTGRGIYLPANSNTIKDNKVFSTIPGSFAIVIDSASSNTIYNNIFYAGTQIGWAGSIISTPNTWSVSASGPNKIGGPQIGGNYWGQIGYTGYSQTSLDSNGDGFCDNPLSFSSVNIDYFPLHDATLKAIIDVTPPANPQQLPALYQFRSVNSTGTIVSRAWTFGDGATSTAQDPSHTYTANGPFTVTLTINSEVNSTSNTTVVIPGSPGLLAYFTGSPVDGNAPLPVQFTDSSTGSPSLWNWQFGDSTTNTTPNPLKTYTNAGIYSVSLTVRNSTYTNTSTRNNYITVYPTADFNFTVNKTYGALSVQFEDLSLGGPDTWSWEFGDGLTSTEQSPAHIYTVLGNYQVNLTVNKTAGSSILSNTISQWVNLTGNVPVADFAMVPPVGDAPLNVTFIDQSTGSPTSWNWQYKLSTGSTWTQLSIDKNPQFSFPSPGTYNINLTASNSYGVSAPVIKNLVVNPVTPVVDFGSAPSSGAPPLVVTFFDLSTGTGPATTYSWNFGDGNSSSGRVVNHTYTDIRSYTVRLTVQNPGASAQYKEGNVTVTAIPVPSASFTTNVTNGHVPLDVKFTDGSSGSPDAWLWTFGDGATSGDQSPVHTYSTPGSYTAGLVASNRYGSTTYTRIITVTPEAIFSVTPASGTLGQVFEFNSNPSKGNPTQWLWNFNGEGSSTLPAPSFTFTTTGVKSVTLTVTSNSVSDTSLPTTISVGQVPLQAAFTSTPVSKTAPLTVNFYDQSSGAGIQRWYWDFGDGNTTSPSDPNPSHYYQNSGTYTVNLTVTNLTWHTSTISQDINIYPDAQWSFSPTSPAVNRNIQFTDESVGGPISGYNWDFRDGTPVNTTQNPVHSYTLSNRYPVLLTVAGGDGLTNNSEAYVNVVPVANFTHYPESGGSPLTIQFVDLSEGGHYYKYWEFGDGTNTQIYNPIINPPIPDQSNPVHVYEKYGNYLVNLSVYSYGGWSTPSSQWVNITGNQPTAAFTASPQSGTIPLTVNFIDQSTGAPDNWTWEYKPVNGSDWTEFSRLKNPSIRLIVANIYDVRLTVKNAFGENTRTETHYIDAQVPVPIAQFTGAPRSGTRPLSVQFTDLSIGGPFTYAWNFGDGNTSTAQNPTWNYTTYGNYDVTLTVTNSYGAQDIETKTGYVSVQAIPGPTAAFTMNQDEGYVPLEVQFTDHSTGSPTSWSWDFGDGSYGAIQSPSHTFAVPGIYTITLTVTNSNGQSQISDQVTVNPKAWFAATPASGPAPLTVSFTDQSTGNPTLWAWNFNNEANSTLQSPPPYTFSTSGAKTVSLNVTSNGRTDSFSRVISVGPVPLRSAFRIESGLGSEESYYAPADLRFIDQSTGSISTWLWQFGDGTFNTTQNPVHAYNVSGNYTVNLRVTGSTGGVNESSQLVSIYPRAMAEAVPSSGVVPLRVNFYDRSTGSPVAWNWEFNDGTNSTQKDPVHTYNTAGVFWVYLRVTGASGLVDETYYWDTTTVEVAPRSNFTWYPTGGNAPLGVQFRDTSEGSPNNFAWDFGDGAVSTEQDPVHIYQSVGSYTVNLTTDSWWGISNTSSKVVNLSGNLPTAAFTMSTSSGPYPLTVNFIDQSSGLAPLSYDWNFGDGSAHQYIQSPTHIYASPGTYSVTLVVSNAGGVSAPVVHPVVVTNPAAPIAAFTMSPNSGPYPLTVNFIDQSSGLAPLSYDWNFGDGSAHQYTKNPTYIYASAGTYNVTLVVTNVGGPSAPVAHQVVVGSPSDPTVAFTATPLSGTVPLIVSFIDQSTANPDTSTYAWDFGDRGSSTERNPVHQYGTTGTYDVSLTVTTNGKSTSLNEEGFITVNSPGTVTADFFAVPPSGGIEPLTVQFFDRSVGNPAPPPTSWYWDFDDPYAPTSEETSTLQSPNHTYTKAGNYTPTLTASNSQGSNTKKYPGVIYVRHIPPVANFSASPTTGYAPFSVTFTDQSTGEALLAWDWNFGDGGTSQIKSPVYTFNTPGTFSVTFKSYNDGGWSAPITKTNLITVLTAPPTPPANIITLYPGWNFVSTAKKLAEGSNTVEVVFANVDFDHHSPLLYDGQTKTWIQFISGTVKPLDGIWVYSKYQMDVPLTFDTTSIPVPPSKQVYRGWNAIGETGVNAISAHDLLTQVGQLNGNWDTLIGYNASSHVSETYIRGSTNPDYSDLKPTFPTKGYWLLMNIDDTLNGLV